MILVLRLVLGAGVGIGVWLVVLGLRKKNVLKAASSFSGDGLEKFRRLNLKKVALGLAVGFGIWVITGIFTAGLVLGLGIAAFKGRLGSKKEMRQRADKSEAIASWCELLYSILLAGGGIEKAVSVSAPISPDLIRPEVKRLAERLESHSLFDALEAFGEELAHPVSDKIVAGLVLSVNQGAQELVELLKSQAESARAESRLVIELESGRARHRTSALIVMFVTLSVAGGLYLFEKNYLDPYRSFPGYLVLLIVGGGFMLGFWLLIRMGADSSYQRYFKIGKGSDG